MKLVGAVALVAAWLSCGAASAQDEHPAAAAAASTDEADLAKQLQNPVASLISVPFQENLDFGFGDDDAVRSTLNFQPVIPFDLGDWNLIVRTIMPVIYQEAPTALGDDAFGLGDTLQSFFLSPQRPLAGFIVAAGPVLQYPTSTDVGLGIEQFGLGPTAVVLRQTGGWTWGALANHVWGLEYPDDRAQQSQTFLQPFLTYTWDSGFTLGANSESVYDWEAEAWTVPINVFATQLVTIGDQPISFQFGGRAYADKPGGGPDWGLRFSIVFLFPE